MNSSSGLQWDAVPKPPEERYNLNERKKSLRRYSKLEQQVSGSEEGRPEKVGRAVEGCKMTSEAFQELMQVRKVEWKLQAEEKRQQGLGRIAAMNSRAGINPLELFPKEIWAMILEELKNPEDRANMCKIHEVFLGLMEHDLIRDVLFPLVIDHKIPFAKKHLILPFAGRQRKHELLQLMNLRLVSKSLRDSVDKWMEDLLLELMITSDSPSQYAEIPDLNSVCLEMSQNLEDMRRILAFSNDGSDEARPKKFFLRSLSVEISPYKFRMLWGRLQMRQRLPACFVLLKDYITELLESIGDQILHFSLLLEGMGLMTDCGVPISLKEIYAMLRKWLSLMPNLKWLVLNVYSVRILNRPFQLNWIGDAFEDIENDPMPTLRELERLDLWESSSDMPVWNCVLNTNPHVRYLYRDGNYGNIGIYTYPSVLSMPLENATFGANRNRRWDFSLFVSRVSQNNWNLKRMTLWVDLRDALQNSIASVFEFLEKFPTLEDVDLHVNHVKIDEINFLRLPNLKNLRMEIGPIVKRKEGSRYFFSLQFLLHCKKLETLAWNNRMYDSQCVQRLMDRLHDEEEGIVDFKGGVVDLCESNIWDAFPRLRSLKVNVRSRPVVNGVQLPVRDENFVYSKK